MEIIKDNLNAAPVDERIAALEKRMRDLEALVKGLTEELLDLKSIAMRLNKVTEERRASELRAIKPQAAPAPSGTVVVGQKKPVQPQAAARAPPAAPEPEKMEMIMQPDGTLKPEKRKSSDYIVASAGYGKKKQLSSGSGKKNDLIVAEDEDKDAAKK